MACISSDDRSFNSGNTSHPDLWDKWNYGGTPFNVIGIGQVRVVEEGFMMSRLTFLLFLLLSGCLEHKDVRSLPNGYKIFSASSEEIYVLNSSDEALVGPVINSVGFVGDVIVVYCGWEKIVANGFQNTVGYNIVDTRKNAVIKNLSEEDVRSTLKNMNIEMPEMKKPLAE